MSLSEINTLLQKNSSGLSTSMEDINRSIKPDSVLSIENLSCKFIDTKNLGGGFINEEKEPIYIDMNKSVVNVSNSYENSYDKNTDSYIFNKSLFIENKKINFFIDLNESEIESIFNNLKDKNYDVSNLLTKNILKLSTEDVIEENIYETMDDNFSLKEKLELIDDLSKVISKNEKLKGIFKDNLIKSMSDVSLNELFSSCEKYEEKYEIQECFLISRFIFLFIEDFNKSNNNKIKLNEDLKRRLNSIILLKNIKLKDNNII